MDATVIVAVCSLVGSALATGGGILISNKLTNYRIEQLEKKVDKHNGLVERMVAVEESSKSAHHRIDELVEAKINT